MKNWEKSIRQETGPEMRSVAYSKAIRSRRLDDIR